MSRRFCSFTLLALLALAGCRREAPPPSELEGVKIDFEIGPRPLTQGTARAAVRLTDESGKPIEKATLKIEGNMNHAGMKPSFADLEEVKPGRYEGDLELTMGGDWFVLIDGTLADGRKFRKKIDVPGVKSR
jgi:hypothetical protein